MIFSSSTMKLSLGLLVGVSILEVGLASRPDSPMKNSDTQFRRRAQSVSPVKKHRRGPRSSSRPPKPTRPRTRNPVRPRTPAKPRAPSTQSLSAPEPTAHDVYTPEGPLESEDEKDNGTEDEKRAEVDAAERTETELFYQSVTNIFNKITAESLRKMVGKKDFESKANLTIWIEWNYNYWHSLIVAKLDRKTLRDPFHFATKIFDMIDEIPSLEDELRSLLPKQGGRLDKLLEFKPKVQFFREAFTKKKAAHAKDAIKPKNTKSSTENKDLHKRVQRILNRNGFSRSGSVARSEVHCEPIRTAMRPRNPTHNKPFNRAGIFELMALSTGVDDSISKPQATRRRTRRRNVKRRPLGTTPDVPGPAAQQPSSGSEDAGQQPLDELTPFK